MLNYILRLIWGLASAVAGAVGTIVRGLLRPVWQVIAQVFRFQPGERRRPIMVFLSLSVILGASLSVVHTLRGRKVPINYGAYEGLGEAAAEQASHLLNARGKVVVCTWDTRQTGNSGVDRVLSQFRRTLRGHAQIQLAGVERFKAAGFGLSADQLRHLLDKHRDADVIVSFLGAPLITETEAQQLAALRPKFIVVDTCADPERLQMLLLQDVVQVAIVPRPPPPAQEQEPTSPREWFERYYEVLKR